MTEKLFTHAGVSRLNGVMKVRFANDAMRVKVLAKAGHVDIDLVEFLDPLTKDAAVRKLIEMDFAQGSTEIAALLEAELDKRVEKADKVARPAKEPKAAKAPKVKAAAPEVDEDEDTVTREEVEAQLELEDAPF